MTDYQRTDIASDADSDLEELQGDIQKFDQSVRDFLASHHGTGDGERAVSLSQGLRGRGARGPRKAAKPRGDITARLSKVNQAFLSGDYDQALDLAFEVIRINAETYQAWTTLASIFRERGEAHRALSAMVYAAHLRPKDVSGWLKCASFSLESVEENAEDRNLHTARLCYSAALRADPSNVEARLGKAAVCHRQGHLSAAISEYKTVLKSIPHDLGLVRKLAEACMDSKNVLVAVPSAIQAYRNFFSREMQNHPRQNSEALWHDIGIFIDLFMSIDEYQEAIYELKKLSRWLVGGASEKFRDDCQNDDREWDMGMLPHSSNCGPDAYATDASFNKRMLPHDLRIRLATCRLKLGHESEALYHLNALDWDEWQMRGFVNDFSFLVFELASELARHGQHILAVPYLRTLREVLCEPDSATLIQLGRCHLALGEHAAAEECFLGALDADEGSIDARVALANMYEKAREDEEALILAAEAMALREAGTQSTSDFRLGSAKATNSDARPGRNISRRHRTRARPPDEQSSIKSSHVVPRRYRAKRLAGSDKRMQEEHARAIKLSAQYDAVRDLKQQIRTGRHDLIPSWMSTSKELVDDFRSLKRFYTWDKYLYFLGPKSGVSQRDAGEQDYELSEMYDRLSRSVAPQTGRLGRELGLSDSKAHRGISFEDWLDLFLDYALGLALMQRREEAYQICQAAKDSIVFQSAEHGFAIYVTWSVCAIYTNDEERCVATARCLMRDGATTDSCRMFALLSRLCQSPVAWYTSGPAQKFILRQIKAIDASHMATEHCGDEDGPEGQAGNTIDICILMLYGHILFTSTSYACSIGYFLRARSLDKTNPMINLSLGLAYVHYGLKRQSANREYLLLQGQALLSQYFAWAKSSRGGSSAEGAYNMGRLFHLLGLYYLCERFYAQAMEAWNKEKPNQDLMTCILINSVFYLMSVKNNKVAFCLLKSKICL